MTTATAGRTAGRLRAIQDALSPREWGKVGAMAGIVVGLNVLGWAMLLAATGHHYHLTKTDVFGLGTGVLAYTLGMRHAFDADHISAIDNTTRKLMAEGKRPLSVGFFFSLGHSTIVFLLAVLLNFGIRALDSQVKAGTSGLHMWTNVVGTSVSGFFLYLIAGLNIVILVSILESSATCAGASSTTTSWTTAEQAWPHEPPLRWLRPQDRHPVEDVSGGGPLRARFRHGHGGRLAGAFRDGGREWAALLRHLVAARAVRRRYVPVRHLRRLLHELRLRLGVRQADTQGVLQHHHHRAVSGGCLLIGTIELVGLLSTEFKLHGTFWDSMANFNINRAGFIIVAMFVVTWMVALLIWRYGHIETRWDHSGEHSVTDEMVSVRLEGGLESVDA